MKCGMKIYAGIFLLSFCCFVVGEEVLAAPGEESQELDGPILLEFVKDTMEPLLIGAKNISVEAGSSVSYKRGITIVDNMDQNPTLHVDSSKVDLKKPGTYPVIYTVTDASGNETSRQVSLQVLKKSEITQETVDALADQVIASLVTEDMSLFDKAYALWNWCRTKITYSYSAGARTPLEGAYQGFHDMSGDCYIYYATYETLLNRCGIENQCVARVGGTSNHWWNLVNLGDGWYHCDSSPRIKGDKFRCFMQTDEQVAAYTAYYTSNHPNHPNYYTFDTSLYPERETTIIVENDVPAVEN